MGFLKRLDERWKNSTLWQFVKFNLVALTITLVQLMLANLLPLLFDRLNTPLPLLLRPIFDPKRLFDGPSPYVTDGVVSWGYVLPFFLSNFLANIYGYFVNMRATFHGTGTRGGLAVYLFVLVLLLLFSTWLQGVITGHVLTTRFSTLARTIAALAAGTVQVAVLFPLEKYVLFREKKRI